MQKITFLQPNRLTFGSGCFSDCIRYVAELHSPSVHVISSPFLAETVDTMAAQLREAGCTVTVNASVSVEPTITLFEAATEQARKAKTTCVVGIGGGSALDLAKLVA